MSDKKSVLRVSGLVFNATDYICLGQLAEDSKLIITPQKERFKLADRLGVQPQVTGMEYRVEASTHNITPLWIARMLGGSIATGGLHYHRETLTKSGSHTLTLTYGAGSGEAVVGIVDVHDNTNNSKRSKVAADPVAQNSYTLSGAVLTLHASDTGTTFEVTYLYSKSGTTSGKIIVPSQTPPTYCRLLLAHAMVNPTTGTISYMVYDCAKAWPDGPLTLGGKAQEHPAVQCNFELENSADGDLVIYPNGYNPLY